MNKMFKKCIAVVSLALSLGFSTMAFAEHDDKDPYKAMCQLTGAYSANVQTLENTNKTYAIQLYGHCGEAPNVIIIDEPRKQLKTVTHTVTVWNSPKKNASYWKQVYKRYYDIDSQGKLVKTWRDEPDDTSFINADIQQPFTLVVKRYCSAKKGSPIFPHAEGDLICNRGVEDEGFLERAFMDYSKEFKGEKQ